jgi:hypothetical protein
MTTTTPTLLEQLAQEVLALRSELASLREQLATEVRTRRLVVVDATGFERIVGETLPDSASFEVLCRDDQETAARMYASDESVGAEAGVALSGGGSIVGELSVRQSGDDGGTCTGDFNPDSITYSASLDVVEDRGRVTLSVDGLEVRSG